MLRVCGLAATTFFGYLWTVVNWTVEFMNKLAYRNHNPRIGCFNPLRGLR